MRAADNVVMRDSSKVLWLQFHVHGDPVPQGSKRHVGNGIMVESSKHLKPWREDVKQSILALDLYAPLTGPVEVEMLFWIRRPKSHFGTGRNADTLKPNAPDYVPNRPDLDKLARAVLDAMQAASLLTDDSQVAVLTAQKRYGRTPGLRANVRPLS
jgi:crossover junction endodeoxyribonuclease RusA